MSESSQKKHLGVGLDVGTSRIVLARRADEGFEFRSELDAFVEVPFSRMTKNVLEREQVPHIVTGNQIMVFGNEADTFANLFHSETRRPMKQGILNPEEPDGLQLIRHIIQALAGPSRSKNEKLCFSVPAPKLGGGETASFHQATLRQILSELGYEAESVDEGLAVIYSELESSNFTGIGISCGGGMCNVCLAYLSVPVFSYSISKAGDFIDEQAAQASGEIATRVRAVKEESFEFGNNQSSKILQAIGVYYDEMIRGLVESLDEAFARSKKVPRIRKPVPLILSGGTALPRGFLERFQKVFESRKLPIEVSEIRLAESPLNATARGALVATLSTM
ncbi:MAG: hypothetical protein IPM24_21260 [Bryobacterales bacterium]|jgi:hypothetical protein|nr:hypothetical protein [Bryobacterales bacterium]